MVVEAYEDNHNFHEYGAIRHTPPANLRLVRTDNKSCSIQVPGMELTNSPQELD